MDNPKIFCKTILFPIFNKHMKSEKTIFVMQMLWLARLVTKIEMDSL